MLLNHEALDLALRRFPILLATARRHGAEHPSVSAKIDRLWPSIVETYRWERQLSKPDLIH